MSRAARTWHRYTVVTVVASAANQLTYVGLLALTSWPAPFCTVVAATAVAVPAFVVLARWVWSAAATALPAAAYWASTVVNVALASAAVGALDGAGAPRAWLVATPFVVYAASWLGRFYVLDRVVFRSRAA